VQPDPHATTAEQEGVAAPSVGGRQSSLREDWAGDPDRAASGRPADAARTASAVETVNAFPLRDVVLVNHYFEGDGAFAALQPYYDQRAYRFEIPGDEFRGLNDRLRDHGYELAPVDALEPYAVVVRKYSHHPESVFSDAVAEFSNADCNVFVLKDAAAVETAVRSGATRLADAPVAVRFPTAHGTGPLTVDDVTVD
jgi:hypothetical protein